VDEHVPVPDAVPAASQRERSSEVESALSNAPIGAALLDAGLRLTWANAALLAMAGVPREAQLGRALRETVPDAGSGLEALLERVRETRQPLINVDTIVGLGGGQTRAWQVTIYPRATSGGEFAGLALLASDVSEQRSAEDAARRAERIDAISTVAAAFAHDMNNQLTAIRSYAQFALSSLPPTDARRADVEQIESAAIRATDLTSRLHVFGRTRPAGEAQANLNDVADDVRAALASRVGDAVEVTLSLAPDLRPAAIDRDEITRAVMGLAANAIEAMPDGGVLTIRTADAVDPRTGTMHPMIEVRDTGVGRTTEVQSHLFEPFFTTKAGGAGAGLGLPTVYAIVRQAGGHLRVASEPGRGSTIEVHLRGSIEEPPSPVEVATIPRQATRTILIVDDDPSIRLLLRRVLETRYRLLIASSGAEALRLASPAEHIDLLVTDLMMSGMDGRELARALRAERPGLQVVIASGLGEEGGELGTSLKKPFTPTQLLETVARALAE
jgi:signal transduction histidine kinase